ncbi:MAG TPA: extracellular solute-binding protein [Actinomycetota bacterium]|nr:extracellular solute-binding protein [Actinomycetota bacterium]
MTACLLLAAAGCGGGGDDEGGGGDNAITFWSAEDNAERVKVLQEIVNDFQEQRGVQVKLVTIAEDQLASQIQSASAAGSLPDVMGSLSLGFAHSLAADDLADGDAANEVIESLGRDTFSERALSLVQSDGKPISIPADTWTQLLVYRKDLFEKEGLETRTPSRRSRPRRPSSTSRAWPGSSPPPRPPTASPSRPSSTSPSPTAASSPTTRATSS